MVYTLTKCVSTCTIHIIRFLHISRVFIFLSLVLKKMIKLMKNQKYQNLLIILLKYIHILLFGTWFGLGGLRWDMGGWVVGLWGSLGLGRIGFGPAWGCCWAWA